MKILNKRPIVLFAVVMITAVLVLLYHNSFVLRTVLLCASGLGALVGLLIWLLHKNKTCKDIFSRIFIVSLAILFSVASVFTVQKLFERDYKEYNGYAIVSGRVAEVGEYTNTSQRPIILDNVTISATEFSKELYGKTRLVVLCDGSREDIFTVGSTLIANAKVGFSSFYFVGEYGLTFNYAAKNITCSGYASEANIEIVDKELSLNLSDKVKHKVEEIVSKSLDSEYQGLALGMLFGDKTTLDAEIAQDFSMVGIAHLLAVSGLHVGFLLAILLFICKICKLKGVPKFIIISALLVFYAYLCGFSTSVVRATIMCICMLYAGCRNKRYDSLNALAISAIINILVNPVGLTTVGFRLSYMAVLSIILLAKPLTKLFSKVFKPKMANTIATMLAVQVGTCGVLISAFKNITLVAIVANFVCIPVASFAYMVLFATICISLILPFANIVIYLFQFIMQIVVKFVHLLSGVKQVLFSSWQGVAITYASIPAMYLSSNYLFISKKVKSIVCIVLWAVITALLLI